MNGLLITNKYLVSEKFSLLKRGFIEAAKELGINLGYMNNQEANLLLSRNKEYDFILFYDKDIKLAKNLEEIGYKLFNNSESIAICDDKYKTYFVLKDYVKQPLTMSSPLIYEGDLTNDMDLITSIESDFSYPIVIKECNGSFGFQVYKALDRNELIDIFKIVGTKNFIIQEFIKTSIGCDVRLQVVGNEVVAAMKRQNEQGDFRANVTNGAKAYSYVPTSAQCEMAIKACEVIGLDFAGVDLLFGPNNEPMLCEVNSNAHIENISNISNVNVYRKILQYIDSKCKK